MIARRASCRLSTVCYCPTQPLVLGSVSLPLCPYLICCGSLHPHCACALSTRAPTMKCLYLNHALQQCFLRHLCAHCEAAAAPLSLLAVLCCCCSNHSSSSCCLLFLPGLVLVILSSLGLKPASLLSYRAQLGVLLPIVRHAELRLSVGPLPLLHAADEGRVVDVSHPRAVLTPPQRPAGQQHAAGECWCSQASS